MALNAAQLALRAGKLTASRIACLMTGDSEKILRLWKEMIGEELPEDISTIWAVRLGECTERLQLEWFEHKQGMQLSRMGEVVPHPKFPWAACTLDGWCEELHCPIECKHCGGREPIEIIIDRYQPQMQWIMEITRSTQCALSVIFGADQPIVEFIEADGNYQQEMVKRGALFMRHVAEHTPPVALDPVPFPVDADKIIDMTGNNEWAAHAGIWGDNKEGARRCEDASKILKAMVPADAKKCFGHGVRITRNRVGYLSLRADQ